MALHRLTQISVAVPDPVAVAAFYRDFGLSETRPGVLATADGGEQLRLVGAPRRRLLDLGLGADDADDLDRIAADAAAWGAPVSREGDAVVVTEPVTATRVVVTVAARYEMASGPEARLNHPGAVTRVGERSPVLSRPQPVRPRKLGHVVIGSSDQATTQRFFLEAIGFKVSDEIPGIAAFLRCSDEHHNLLVQDAPVAYLHHTSWTVDDVDEIGRGAKAVLDTRPDAHVWGLGRHYVGSNFFWYLRDPAGNFAEYHSDMDVIVDDERWEPGAFADARALYAWGPPVPASFLAPDDLAELIAG